MKRVEKHRTNKRKRTRMTVQAFCTCMQPSDCIQACGMDIDRLYGEYDLGYIDAVNSYRNNS